MGAAYEGWAKLELFGHRVIAGYVREVEQYGEKFCQIVTPELEAVPADPANYQRALPSMPAYTQSYGGKAIYCLTPCDEQTARRIAERIRHEAITPFETRPPQLEAASAASEYTDEQLEADQDDGELDGADRALEEDIDEQRRARALAVKRERHEAAQESTATEQAASSEDERVGPPRLWAEKVEPDPDPYCQPGLHVPGCRHHKADIEGTPI